MGIGEKKTYELYNEDAGYFTARLTQNYGFTLDVEIEIDGVFEQKGKLANNALEGWLQENARPNKEVEILTELQEVFQLFGTLAETYPISNYSNFKYYEIEELAKTSPYIVYNKPNPKGNPMYEVGSYSVHESILELRL